jgi:hypothetical protein
VTPRAFALVFPLAPPVLDSRLGKHAYGASRTARQAFEQAHTRMVDGLDFLVPMTDTMTSNPTIGVSLAFERSSVPVPRQWRRVIWSLKQFTR